MEYAIIIFFVIAMGHFIYESTILPNIRLRTRFKLFAIRDELRSILMEENLPQSSRKAATLLDESVCKIINRLPYYNLITMLDASREFRNNTKLLEKVDKRRAIIKANSDERVSAINTKIQDITFSAFLNNSLGWIYLALPLGAIVLCFLILAGKFITEISKVKSWMNRLNFTSNNDFDSMPHVLS